MADAFVQMPDDAANTGKKIRTQTRSVDGSTVHEHYNIIQDPVSDVQANVRDYTNGNPLAVALTNASGDTYNSQPREPVLVTRTGLVTAAGSKQIAGPYTGQCIKITRLELQAQAGDTMSRFSSGASGDPLSVEWILGAREGVAQYVSAVGGGHLMKTNAGQALVLEHYDTNPVRYAVTFYTGDSI
jgi:hypothetical protein